MTTDTFVLKKLNKHPLLWLFVLYTTIFGIIANAMIFVIVIELSNDVISLASIIAIPYLIVVTLFALDLVLWQLIGKDTLILHDNYILLTQSGRIFKKKYQIQISQVSQISNEYGQGNWLQKFWSPSSQGPICIKINNEKICFGRGVDAKDCEKIIQTISEKYPQIPIVATAEKHRITITEKLFIVWTVLAITIFIPAWWVVPAYQRHFQKQQAECDSLQLAWIKQNYPKKYCYSTEYGSTFNRIYRVLHFDDSLYADIYIRQCVIADSTITSSIQDSRYYIPNILPENIKFCGYEFMNFSGIVYVVRTREEISLVYSQIQLYEPFWIPNRYLHDNKPIDNMDLLIRQSFPSEKTCWEENLAFDRE